ncbi:putative bifunctional diguanylate cyclase/phosphodiesterase [Microvirga lenta]|uniref:putative bifunctional diguanylate cyclase/phosphodiesterase n=1 Tax=Microvirga lenta TaxID=2881337 RepID=UPI001CFE5AC5|nr:EAL domain-containing protein [Microvirga lenta]MCB5173574.1 EAL domain-containing protein [Microvirga lenta]
MSRMLLSRNDILAVYDSPGKETLQLLTGGTAVSKKIHGAEPAPQPSDSDPRSRSNAVDQEPWEGGARQSPAAQVQAARTAIDQRLKQPTSPDTLTGLSSRSQFQSRGGTALDEARRDGRMIALFLMGLDRFKDLNNTLGHQAGDAVLIEIARNLQSLMEGNDLAARYGGDEFALMLTGLSSESDVGSVAGKMLEIAAASIRHQTSKLRSSASLGVALFPEHGSDIDELIQSADIALNRAKAEGRGRAQLFAPQMRTALMERLQQLSAFQNAVEVGQVLPYYQPQMRLSDRRSYGFEALARWALPNGDILYPAHFKAALEDADAAILLGEHMLQRVSDDLRRWRASDMPVCKMSINVTAPELKRGDYAEKVARIFSEKELPPSQLTVEITESVLLDDKATQISETLSELRRLGVSISLDDFGTGFASLTHLKSYAVDQIKIDRSFVADLASNSDDWAIVRATLGLAKSLGMRTVAEGLENWTQLKCLQTLGCDYGQGFFFSPAVPADEAEAYFRLHRAYKKAKLHQFVLPGPPNQG